jgi:hypothetical protein
MTAGRCTQSTHIQRQIRNSPGHECDVDRHHEVREQPVKHHPTTAYMIPPLGEHDGAASCVTTVRVRRRS